MSNYTGPSWLDNQLNGFPMFYYQATSPFFVEFHPSPKEVNDHPENFGIGVAFIPVWTVLIPLAFYILGHYISMCCRCDCCATARHGCKCYCPDPNCHCCCRSFTFRKAECHTRGGYLFFIVFLGAIVLAGLLVAFAGTLELRTDTSDINDNVDAFNNYDDTVKANLNALITQTDGEESQIASIARQIVGLPFITPDLAALINASVTSDLNADQDLKNAQSSWNLDLGLDSTTSNVRWYLNIQYILALVVLPFMLLMITAVLLVSFFPDDPNKPCIYTLETVMNTLFIPFMLLMVVLFTVSIAAGVICQDPNGYALEFANNNANVNYYLVCSPGSTSPTFNDLNDAFLSLNSTVDPAKQLLNVTAQNGKPQPLYQNTANYIVNVTDTLVFIQKVQDILNCTQPHEIIVDIENQACHSWNDNCFMVVIGTLVFFLVFGWWFCIMPRRDGTRRYDQMKEENGGGGEEPKETIQSPQRPPSPET